MSDRTVSATDRSSHPAASVYLGLAADGAELDTDQRSRSRKALVLAGATLLLAAAPLNFAASAQGAGKGPQQGVLVKAAGDDDDDDDRGGPDTATGGDDTAPTADTAKGETDQTAGDTTDGDGIDTVTAQALSNDGTRGDGVEATLGVTSAARDAATGVETIGPTDRPGLNTGVSTRGETDPGDNTGKTERR